MAGDFDKLALALSSTMVSTDLLNNLTSILKQENIQSLAASCQSLLTLERWSWKLLSEDSIQWINEPIYIELLHTLASFNQSLIFDCDTIDNNTKISLLLPESIDQINRIFQNIDRIDDDDSPYLIIITLVFDNHSYFFLDHLPYCQLAIIDHIGEHLTRNYIMNKQFKVYLSQLQQPHMNQTKITAKMLFYIKTCSFYFYVYLSTKFQNFFYTADEIVRYLRDDYLRILHTHVPAIHEWNKEFLSCIAHLIGLLCRCCWWGGDMALPMKILLPTEQVACEYMQDLMTVISYAPFYSQIKSQRSNDVTVLLESCIFFVLDVAETQNVNWLFRANASYQTSLLAVAEAPINDIICLGAYDIMSVVLADEQIKALKMHDGAAILAFNMLRKAWHDPFKMYKQVPIVNILQGEFLERSSIVQ